MISFCQDLSISYEYHIYENKTIKKITHKRNGSNISQKTFVKASKLSVVSKKLPHKQNHQSFKGIQLTQPDKKVPQTQDNKPHHRRTISEFVQKKANESFDRRPSINQNGQNDVKFLEAREARSIQSIQVHKKIFQPRVSFNQPSKNYSKNVKQKVMNLINHPPFPLKPISVKPKVLFLNEKTKPFQKTQSLESRTIKIKESVEKLDQSIQTKKYNDFGKSDEINNHSYANSFTSYSTFVKGNHQNIGSSLIQDSNPKQKMFDRSLQFNFFTPRQTGIKSRPAFQETAIFNPQIEGSFMKIKKASTFPYEKVQQKILIPQSSFQIQNCHNQNSILFDAASIVSKTLDEQEIDDDLSVVEQRNFFFEEQQNPDHAFKKSIQKFIFFEAGYISQNRKWILFKNVQEKENGKIYSIKQFSSQHEKQYFDEYQMYLCLKNQSSQFMSQPKGNQAVFLHLFNALSNNQQKKLHLVKQSFQYVLNDFIYHIKKKNTLKLDRFNILISEKHKIESEIDKIFDFFATKNIKIRDNETLQIEDFVICHKHNSNQIIKFHSLYKLEKSGSQNKNKGQLSLNKQKAKRQIFDQLNEKIHAAFFFQ